MSEDPTKLLKDDYDAMVKFLQRERDELRVKAHLAKADAKDEWEELEEKWRELQKKANQIGDAADEASHDIKTAAEILMGELKHGYVRIKAALKENA